MGDPRGIGPETIVSALADRSIARLANFLVIGDLKTILHAKKILKLNPPIDLLDLGIKGGARSVLRYIDAALRLIDNGFSRALVTAPVNKASITKSGIRFSGHTEYLQDKSRAKDVAMIFIGRGLKVATVTRHIRLKDVSRSITKKGIIDVTTLTAKFLKDSMKINNPKIGVCALNPHSGERGVLGNEEIKTIAPAVKMLRRNLKNISGPLPADSAFNSLYKKKIHGLVAMYHDQAMIPVKMVGRDSCVNVTLGLPFIRTSPVFGTAYDIAKKGKADPSSMKEAIRLACHLARC